MSYRVVYRLAWMFARAWALPLLLGCVIGSTFVFHGLKGAVDIIDQGQQKAIQAVLTQCLAAPGDSK